MRKASGKYRILVVDDEVTTISSVRSLLSSETHIEVAGAASATEALSMVAANPYRFAVILMDYRPTLQMGMSGAEATQKILEINPDQIIAIHSGDTSRQSAMESWRAGAADFLEKTSSPDVIRAKMLACLQKYIEGSEVFEDFSSSENRRLIESVGLAGASPEMAKVAGLIEKAAAGEAPVLITGESGSGKEEVAKAIHRLSRRKSMPFVAVNVGAVTKNLFESAMFGHLKGSFTNAVADSAGFFRRASHGTLFLDEIGELQNDEQVKFLRVLQEKEFYPVGASKAEKANVRVIAATNKNLEAAIADKTFREDLFYRLDVIRIEVPPLRERMEDVRPLVEHFRRTQGKNRVFLMEVIEKFEAFPWPGNVRQLYSELTKLCELLPDEPKITLKHLDSKFFAESAAKKKMKDLIDYEQLRNQQKSEEIQLIKQHLRLHGNIRDAASEGLRVPYSTLHSRMRALNIQTKGSES